VVGSGGSGGMVECWHAKEGGARGGGETPDGGRLRGGSVGSWVPYVPCTYAQVQLLTRTLVHLVCMYILCDVYSVQCTVYSVCACCQDRMAGSKSQKDEGDATRHTLVLYYSITLFCNKTE
jgi:hypothetical protein